MTRSIFVLILAIFASVTIAGQAAALDKSYKSKQLTRLQFGVFCALQPMTSQPAPNTAEGWIHVPNASPKFHWKSQKVPASKSIAFGIQAMSAAGEISGATLTVQHPPIKGSTQDSWATNFHTAQVTTDFYRFDFPYELVTGLWTFQAAKDGKVLYQVSFEVVPANAMPDIAAACQG